MFLVWGRWIFNVCLYYSQLPLIKRQILPKQEMCSSIRGYSEDIHLWNLSTFRFKTNRTDIIFIYPVYGFLNFTFVNVYCSSVKLNRFQYCVKLCWYVEIGINCALLYLTCYYKLHKKCHNTALFKPLTIPCTAVTKSQKSYIKLDLHFDVKKFWCWHWQW